MSDAFQVTGNNDDAPFTLKAHRGDGMALLGMNWKDGEPPKDFVGFAIEYKEPGGAKFFALKNRLCFAEADGSINPNKLSTRLSPIRSSAGSFSRATRSSRVYSSSGSHLYS